MSNRRDEVERIIREGFADDSDHVVAMETVSGTWLVTAGSDGQSSTLVSGFDAMKNEVIRCMWPDMDGGEEADDMRAEMDDPEFWEGDRWSCGLSFEDGYINVQRVLASRLAKQGWHGMESAPVTKDPECRPRVLGWGAFRGQTRKSIQIMDWTGWIGSWSVSALPFIPELWQPLPVPPSPAGGSVS